MSIVAIHRSPEASGSMVFLNLRISLLVLALRTIDTGVSCEVLVGGTIEVGDEVKVLSKEELADKYEGSSVQVCGSPTSRILRET